MLYSLPFSQVDMHLAVYVIDFQLELALQSATPSISASLAIWTTSAPKAGVIITAAALLAAIAVDKSIFKWLTQPSHKERSYAHTWLTKLLLIHGCRAYSYRGDGHWHKGTNVSFLTKHSPDNIGKCSYLGDRLF